MMKKRKWPVYLLLILCAVVTVGPFLWMILTSFKSYEESIQIPPTIFPEVFTVGSYREVVDKFPFFDFYVNTFLVLLLDRKSTRLNSSHSGESRMPSSA